MRKLALFLNGEKPTKTPNLEKYDAIFCTDGAYHFLEDINIIPDLIIGDFDSIDTLPKDIPHIHTPNQNFTDFEKALKIIIKKGFSSLDVFAANGLEQDHFMGNMSTAFKYRKDLSITFFDDKQKYFFLSKKNIIKKVKNKMISLFPYPKAKNVLSKGLQFPLNGMNLNMIKNKIGIRNKAIEDEIIISFSKGAILIFIEQ